MQMPQAIQKKTSPSEAKYFQKIGKVKFASEHLESSASKDSVPPTDFYGSRTDQKMVTSTLKKYVVELTKFATISASRTDRNMLTSMGKVST